MFKLVVLSSLLVSCLADPFVLPSWFREAAREQRQPRGCADRAEGWRACARLNSSEALAPHGRDCSLFFYCSSSARPACRRCPGGLHFNPQLQVCDWPENVNCSPRPPRPRPTVHPGHNGTTPYPATPDDGATVTVIDGSTTPDGNTSYETTTELPASFTYTAPTSDPPTSPTTSSTQAPTTEPSVYSSRNYIPWARK